MLCICRLDFFLLCFRTTVLSNDCNNFCCSELLETADTPSSRPMFGWTQYLRNCFLHSRMIVLILFLMTWIILILTLEVLGSCRHCRPHDWPKIQRSIPRCTSGQESSSRCACQGDTFILHAAAYVLQRTSKCFSMHAISFWTSSRKMRNKYRAFDRVQICTWIVLSQRFQRQVLKKLVGADSLEFIACFCVADHFVVMQMEQQLAESRRSNNEDKELLRLGRPK